jgi:hypothetical protein
MIAAFLMAQITPTPADPQPIATTIAAIRANPKKFHGQVVRLHGYVNSCEASICQLDERLKSAAGGAGQELSLATNDKFDKVARSLVPTYVELDARVDATCLLAACLDHPALTIVTLRGVVSPEPPPFENR